MIACIYDTIVIPVYVGRVARMVVDKTNVIIYRVWNLRKNGKLSCIFNARTRPPHTPHSPEQVALLHWLFLFFFDINESSAAASIAGRLLHNVLLLAVIASA